MYWYNFTAKPKKRGREWERVGGGRGGGAENLSWPSDELTRDFAWRGHPKFMPGSCLNSAECACVYKVLCLQLGAHWACNTNSLPGGTCRGPEGGHSGQSQVNCAKRGSTTPLDKLQPDIFDSWMRWCVKSVICKIDVYPQFSSGRVWLPRMWLPCK